MATVFDFRHVLVSRKENRFSSLLRFGLCSVSVLLQGSRGRVFSAGGRENNVWKLTDARFPAKKILLEKNCRLAQNSRDFISIKGFLLPILTDSRATDLQFATSGSDSSQIFKLQTIWHSPGYLRAKFIFGTGLAWQGDANHLQALKKIQVKMASFSQMASDLEATENQFQMIYDFESEGEEEL